MKYFVIIICALPLLYAPIIAGEIPSMCRDQAVGAKMTITSNEVSLKGGPGDNNCISNSWPIIIYYCLNNSHSTDWVRKTEDGVIGISYFQRTVGSPGEGTLLYRTIYPDGSENTDSVVAGIHLETSVLLYDSLSNPNIFLARSNDADQIIERYHKNSENQWQSDTIIHFNSYGGKFIYEMSAASGPDHSFHLLILKTRSNIDSYDFMDAWLGSYLFHVTNENGSWEMEVVNHYNMAFTYDMYAKCSGRQDIAVDNQGYVHAIFSEQINGGSYPSRLLYANNKSGAWQIEAALNYDTGTRDDAGWYPSLSLDTCGTPYIACAYIDRVPTGSATYCKLLLLDRKGENDWQSEVIAEFDDGYFGGDGRDYTGALNHLFFDRNNTAHIIFSDIASTHYPTTQALSVGNIRYGVRENETWNISTIYRQPLPTDFFHATEMYGMCLTLSENMDSIRVIGQELEITGEYQYSCRLLDIPWTDISVDVGEETGSIIPDQYCLYQNYPNPFNPVTHIEFSLPRRSHVKLSVYDILGRKVASLIDKSLEAGFYMIDWNAESLASGIYFYRLITDQFTQTKKMSLIK